MRKHLLKDLDKIIETATKSAFSDLLGVIVDIVSCCVLDAFRRLVSHSSLRSRLRFLICYEASLKMETAQ